MKEIIVMFCAAIVTATFCCAGEPATTPEALGKEVAMCLISNDLQTAKTVYTQSDAFFQKEMTNSWRRIREEVELRRIPWDRAEFKKVEMKKLATHGTSRVADIVMVFKVADDEFRIMLDEAHEKDGRWYVLGFDWMGIIHIDRTTRGSVYREPATGSRPLTLADRPQT